jgi:hypothetical protein
VSGRQRQEDLLVALVLELVQDTPCEIRHSHAVEVLPNLNLVILHNVLERLDIVPA